MYGFNLEAISKHNKVETYVNTYKINLRNVRCFSLDLPFFCLNPIYFKIQEGNLFLSHYLKPFNESEINHSYFSSYLENSLPEFQSPYNNVFAVPFGVSKVFFYEEKVEFSYFSDWKTSISISIKEALQKSIGTNFNKTAAHVSGGLDSTGLASIISAQDLKEYPLFCTVESPFKSTQEVAYIKAFEEKHNQKVTRFEPEPDIHGFLSEFIQETGAFAALNIFPGLNVNLIKSLNKDGIGHLIQGLGGDNITGHGEEYLEEIINLSKHQELRKTIENFTQGNVLQDKYQNWYSFSEIEKYNLTLIFFILKYSSKTTFYRFKQIFLFLKNSKGIKGLKHYLKKRNTFTFKPEFLKIEPAQKSITFIEKNSLAPALKKVLPKDTIEAIKYYFHLGSMYNISIHYPFFNEEVFAFSQTVSAKDKFGLGFTRKYYRDQLSGILPDLVRDRINKTAFDEFFISEIRKLLNKSLEKEFSSEMYKFIKKEHLMNIFSKFESSKPFSQEEKQLSSLVFRLLNVNIFFLNKA